MNNNKENIKEKNLKQIRILIIFIISLAFIGYLLLPSIHENSNNIQNENTQTNTINNLNTNISIDNIPQYSGQMVISINNDIPYFEDKDITTNNFEDYSILDKFERAGVAFANICKYTMPPEGTKRGSISYKPAGWVQYLYGENKLAIGVEIEAKSVEEEGVSFNKFIYNVQDNFEIDYSTGKAKLIE